MADTGLYRMFVRDKEDPELKKWVFLAAFAYQIHAVEFLYKRQEETPDSHSVELKIMRGKKTIYKVCGGSAVNRRQREKERKEIMKTLKL